MADKIDSKLPEGPISGDPILCLDIDGVSSPLGQDYRYHVHAPNPFYRRSDRVCPKVDEVRLQSTCLTTHSAKL